MLPSGRSGLPEVNSSKRTCSGATPRAARVSRHELDEFERAAEEPFVDVVGVDGGAQQRLQLLGVDPAAEQRRDPLFAREHVVQRQPGRVFVLQVREFLKEHHVHGGLVGVDEVEAGLRVGRQQGAGDGDHGGDAGARGDRDEGAGLARQLLPDGSWSS